MHARTLGLRSALFLCAAAGAAAVGGLFDVRALVAEPGETVSLLVKCDRADLPRIVRVLDGHGARVWALDSMQRLSPPTPAATSPALPDATRVLQAVLLAAQPLRGTGLAVDEVAVQPRRALVRCQAPDAVAFDALRRALADDAYLASRAVDATRAVEPGAQQALPDGRWSQAFSLRFRDEVDGDARLAPSGTGIPTPTVQRHALEAGMQVLYAGAEQDDPNRTRGFRTMSREFTFAPVRLGAFTKLLGHLAADPAGLTVIEIRWKRAGPEAGVDRPDDLLQKPVLRLAVRVPLAD